MSTAAERRTADERQKADELRETYCRTWEICTDMAIGVAAWRHTYLTPAQLGRHKLNVMCAGDLDELAKRLADQEAAQ
ncbi:hypothetical protein [Nonomuraea basaltis]|uniref:hypothetical protein n=1 Tax=Nonomuraea basaltis TaxID=2495887 RepID=UPI00110C618D|nr:hypothetical protein [Nonomuraea basaltis]TMR98883.1 hypothetical protein EJK15_10085 [Nonomuraea basaltis]